VEEEPERLSKASKSKIVLEWYSSRKLFLLKNKSQLLKLAFVFE
jgi:hypothetical protein